MFDSIDSTQKTLTDLAYVPDPGLATCVFLAIAMEKALFLEGEPGVGKTEVAKVLARALDAPLIRLQCFEGLDLAQAAYEWNYPRQLLAIQAGQGRSPATSGPAADPAELDIFDRSFLLERPLLQAIDAAHEKAPVLLIDELDRADEEFESFLLELLGDFQITIPEIGTIRARHRPVVIVTSNRTREIHDALKRRCIYHWIDYPSFDKELEIVRRKSPDLEATLGHRVVAFVQALREQEIQKRPGVAETLDWSRALLHLGTHELLPETVDATLGLLLKVQDDLDTVRGPVAARLLASTGAAHAPTAPPPHEPASA